MDMEEVGRPYGSAELEDGHKLNSRGIVLTVIAGVSWLEFTEHKPDTLW